MIVRSLLIQLMLLQFNYKRMWSQRSEKEPLRWNDNEQMAVLGLNSGTRCHRVLIGSLPSTWPVREPISVEELRSRQSASSKIRTLPVIQPISIEKDNEGPFSYSQSTLSKFTTWHLIGQSASSKITTHHSVPANQRCENYARDLRSANQLRSIYYSMCILSSVSWNTVGLIND